MDNQRLPGANVYRLIESLSRRLEVSDARIAAMERGMVSGLFGTDQTIKGSHDRLDALMGAGSLTSQWYNRLALPSSPNANDAEMTAAPAGNWAWTTAPSAYASSGVNYTFYPHNQYVYIYGSGAGQADLRCNDAGNLPRYKSLVIGVPAYPDVGAGGWTFTMRSVVDANNYIEWLLSAAGGLPMSLQAWYCTGGARTQVGSSIAVYWPTLWLQLGNNGASDYLNWNVASPWCANPSFLPAITGVAGQRAANVNYLQLLYDQGNSANFQAYLVDHVRFSA